jgi:ubiquinone biosynthesis protein COQ4
MTAMTAPHSVEALPPTKPRPVQWRRLGEQLSILWEADPANVLDAAYSTGDAIGGMSEERQLERMLRAPEGRALLELGVSLTDALADHEALAAMPAGSLGREFLTFSLRHGLDPRALIESQHEMSRDYKQLDPTRRWVRDRFTVMHDLWHVLAGYDATHAGESALMCFSCPQRVNDRALPIFIVMSLLTKRIGVRDAWAAFQRGRRCVFLSTQPFEQLLERPLADAREQLGISPPRVAHPAPTILEMLIPRKPRESERKTENAA